jgi:hypothetical protein
MTFAYCLREAGDLPCARVISCWQSAFDVEALLRERLKPDDWNRFACARP